MKIKLSFSVATVVNFFGGFNCWKKNYAVGELFNVMDFSF